MMNAATREKLSRNMMTLDAGLHQIADEHGEHVLLRDEDPEVFGAGHYILYPLEGSALQFTITEQYTGTDWSDPDRVPTSWQWSADALTARTERGYPWVTLERGEVASADVSRLLGIARGWAGVIRALSEREAALTPDTAKPAKFGPEYPGRTLRT